MKFEFDLNETNIILNALGKAPYETVFQVIDKLRTQAAPQLQEVPSEAPRQTPNQSDVENPWNP